MSGTVIPFGLASMKAFAVRRDPRELPGSCRRQCSLIFLAHSRVTDNQTNLGLHSQSVNSHPCPVVSVMNARRTSSTSIRKYTVSFGNPALGTYHGNVYTVDGASGHLSPPFVEGAAQVQRVVAMTNVPPEQVPEGILNLSRAYSQWIDHVRIVISEGSILVANRREREPKSQQDLAEAMFSYKVSPNAAAMESAASILAAEQLEEERRNSSEYSETAENAQQQHLGELPTRNYLVLIEVCNTEAAETLVEDLNGKPYTMLDETQTCSVCHVIALHGENGVSLTSPFFAPATKTSTDGVEIVPSRSTESQSPETRHRKGSKDVSPKPSHSEDYNCAVCLEHMDLDHPSNEERTAILTTVCNHSFHLDCLLKWQDSPCPVCRYDHSGLNEALSQCHLCGTTENNYVCLICGTISCGAAMIRHTPELTTASNERVVPECRSVDSHDRSGSQLMAFTHAGQHYDETLHAYALDTETQHVWDFAGQGYVHRLLQNKEDGKLVEINDPSNTTSQERSLSPGLSEAQEGEVVHRKLEGFASQYYTLLKSQLEQQRIYYEGRLEEIRREHTIQKPKKRASDLINALKQERHQLSRRLDELQTRCTKTKDDVAFLISMNESLEANREALRNQIAQAQQQRLDGRRMLDECLPPLQEKVTRLMLQLECQELDDEKMPAAKS